MKNVEIIRPSTRDAIRDYLLRTHGRDLDHNTLVLSTRHTLIDLRPSGTIQ